MASTSDRPDPTDRSTPGRAPAQPGTGTAGPVSAALAVTLAAGAAILALGRFVEDPAAAAEAGYLATLSVLLLGCVAALGSRGGHAVVLPWSAVAVVSAVWVLPPGPGRGAAVLALLVAAVAVAAWRARPPRALTVRHGAGTGADAGAGTGTDTVPATLRATGALLPLAVPLAVAVQVIFRGGDLLRPALDAHTLVVFVAMPLAVALMVAFLAVRRGAAAAGISAATVVLWTGGLNVAATVAFLALAAGEVLRDPGAVGAGSAGPGRRSAILVRACAVAALAAPFAWQPRTAAVAAAAGLLMTGGVAAAAVVTAAAVAALFLAPLQGWAQVAHLVGLGLLLLPLFHWLAARRVPGGEGRALNLAAGLALVVAACRCAPALAGAATGDVTGVVAVPAVAAPLALLGFLAVAGRGNDGPAVALQQLWSGGLLLAAGVASAYPWLRPDAARSVLEALDLHPDGLAPLAVVVVASLAAGALGLLARRTAIPKAAGWATLATAVVALLLLAALAAPAPPFGHTLVGHPGVLLSHGAPRFEADLPTPEEIAGDAAPEIRRLALVGSLVRAEGVADGTPVATVTVLAGDHPLATWQLTAGDDLGEWAARRPAVAVALDHRPPPPWASWVAPAGDYLGQVYRAEHDARGPDNTQAAPGGTNHPAADGQAAPGSPLRLVLQREPGLPPTVQVHVRRLEAWP